MGPFIDYLLAYCRRDGKSFVNTISDPGVKPAKSRMWTSSPDGVKTRFRVFRSTM